LLTAEDPVEYDIEGIMQVPINEAIGLTFAECCAPFCVRILTASWWVKPAILRRRNFHSGVAHGAIWFFPRCTRTTPPGAVTRLIDMNVEPFMISSSLEAVLAQRLIRKICTKCRTTYEPKEAVLTQLGLSPHDIGDKQFYYGKGCDACNNTGYKGRKGIYELLEISDPVRELINQRAPTVVLRQKAIELGMVTLRDDGLRCIYDGDTTLKRFSNTHSNPRDPACNVR